MEENFRCGRNHRDPAFCDWRNWGPGVQSLVRSHIVNTHQWSLSQTSHTETLILSFNKHSSAATMCWAPSLGLFALDSVVYWFRINFKLMSVCCDFGFSCLELWVDFGWCVQMPWKILEALAVVAVVDVTCKLYLPPFPPPIELLLLCNLKIRLW